jgi:photosystem II stability/assembly factor-like uncharacterized protein
LQWKLYAVCYDCPENSRVYRSTDAGSTWEFLGRILCYSVTSLAIDPFDPDVIYAAARGSGLYRSDDGVARWNLYSLPCYGQAFDWDVTIEGRVYSGGYHLYSGSYHAALFVSTDRDSTWSASMPRPDTTFRGCACAADPSRPGTVYLGSDAGYIHRTTDAGVTWTLANQGIPSTASV